MILALVAIDHQLPEVRLCKNCKYLLGRRHENNTEQTWKCFKLPLGIDVVNGNTVYENCISVRNNGNECGIKGDWYEEYVPPVRTENLSSPTIGGQSATELTTEIVFDPEQLKKNREAAAEAIKARKAAKGLL